ncbi:MAG TPA: hypothetical protein VH113_11150 [Gemmatimonadales bacterium]|jgi:hypothetical protein|nr:hypothetical protein [Gemmatimonadales bacterium]
MNERLQTHLTPEEVELWATGLLSAARTFHLTDCAECLALAERERKLLVELAQLQRFAPSAEFAEKVLAQVRIPSPSGSHYPG